MKKDAYLSDCKKHRYWLLREWDDSKPKILFIGLNPSYANETIDDRTITRLISFSRDFWGYGGFYIANLFSLITPFPEVLFKDQQPVGPKNDTTIQHLFTLTEKTIIMWGNGGAHLKRDIEILPLISTPWCFGKTVSNHPKHPLYLPYSTQLIPF